MAVPVIMPRQGQSVETCIMGEWHKQVGDTVCEGDILFSYETDKASFEEEAKCDGTLLVQFFEEGDEVPVLVNVAVIGAENEAFDSFSPNDTPQEETAEPAMVEAEAAAPVLVSTNGHSQETNIRISPLARRMASENNIDIETLKGSGPNGRIIARDIQTTQAAPAPKQPAVKVAPQPTPAPAPSAPAVTFSEGEDFKVEKLSNIRKLIAKSMHESLQNSAQLTHHMGADARQLLALRKKFKQQLNEGTIQQNITLNDMICFAVIKALKKFPQVNAHFMGDSKKYFHKVNLGLAVDTERGLMVPSIPAADDLSIEGLSSRMKSTADQCRKGSFNPELLRPESASFTVSNLGNYGVEMFTPVINLPQSAILGVCTTVNRPVDLGNGAFGFVPYLGLSLTYDHRSLDGGEATLFLAEIKNQIENLNLNL
ncbi:2-oxo acid dehydrogenase subunit E2 [Prolixibacteraceae bacterium JC049]|nr:2-oxo acid dehydrogenase subunit E2 [Prolixibacteraceae bacterium JC049]